MMADEQPTAADAAAAETNEVDVEQNVPGVEAEEQPPAAEPAAAEPDEVDLEQGGPGADAEVQAQAVSAEEAAPEAEVAPDAPAEEDGGEVAPAPAAAAPKAEPVAIVAPKERRRLKRAAKAPAARGPVSPQDRQAERDTLRVKNAKARRGERMKARAAKPASEVAPPAAIEHAVGRPRARQGIVVSDKAAKTITVRVDTSRRHRRYKKIVRSSKTLHAHDEHNQAHEGDLVRVVETRPLSATKRWRLLEVLERAK